MRLQLTAVLVAVVVSGCASTPATAPSAGRLVRAGLPSGGLDAPARDFVEFLSGERLFLIGDDGRPIGRLVERWSVSEDRLTWTFTLHANLVFHDGSPATADAVKEAIERAAARPDAGPGLLDIAAIEASDARTFVTKLRRPSAFLADDLTGVSLARQTPSGRAGIGPLVLESSAPDRYVMRAFDGYYQGPPSIDRLELRAFPTVRAAWAAMMRDEIDVLFELGREAVEFVEGESSVQVHSFARPWIFVLWFNQRHPALARPAVRRALSMAVDREAVVQTALRSRGRAAEGYLWPQHWTRDRSVPSYGYNPEEARRALDRAGFPLVEDRGRRRRFALTCLVPSGFSPFESMALMTQKQLAGIGVDLDVQLLGFDEWARRVQLGEFESFLFYMASQRTLAMPYQFLHSPAAGRPPLVNAGYSAADAPLDALRSARTDDEVRAAVGALQRILYNDPPGIFIAWDERSRALSRRFAVPFAPGRDILANLWRLRPAEGHELSALDVGVNSGRY